MQYSFFHIVQELGHNIALLSASTTTVGKLRLLSKKVKREIDNDELLFNIRVTVRREGLRRALIESSEVRRFMRISAFEMIDDTVWSRLCDRLVDSILQEEITAEDMPPLYKNEFSWLMTALPQWYSDRLKNVELVTPSEERMKRWGREGDSADYVVPVTLPLVEVKLGNNGNHHLRYCPPCLQRYYFSRFECLSYNNRTTYIDHIRKNVFKKIKYVCLCDLVDLHELSLQTFSELMKRKIVVKLSRPRYYQIAALTRVAESLIQTLTSSHRARMEWSKHDVVVFTSVMDSAIEQETEVAEILLDKIDLEASEEKRLQFTAQVIHITELAESRTEYRDRLVSALTYLAE